MTDSICIMTDYSVKRKMAVVRLKSMQAAGVGTVICFCIMDAFVTAIMQHSHQLVIVGVHQYHCFSSHTLSMLVLSMSSFPRIAL